MSVRLISLKAQVSVLALFPHSSKLHIMCLLVSSPQKYHKSHTEYYSFQPFYFAF